MQTHTSVIESVVTITQQRDKNALESCLLDELVNMGDWVHSVILFNVEGSSFSRQCKENCIRISDNLKPDPAFPKISEVEIQRLSASGKPAIQYLANQDQCLLVPIIQDETLTAILQVIGEEITADVQFMVLALARIYGNFTHLLNESEQDNLTGLYNRRTFEQKLKQLLYYQAKPVVAPKTIDAERRKDNLDNNAWLAMLDIDHFKRVNDNFGHVYGDEVLLIFSQKMREIFRHNDLLFRFGGEEFVVVLEPIDLAGALLALQRFRQTIADYEFPRVGHVTVSLGFAKVEKDDYPLAILNRADKALYYAKNAGRNQISHYETLVEEGKLKHKEHASGDIELF